MHFRRWITLKKIQPTAFATGSSSPSLPRLIAPAYSASLDVIHHPEHNEEPENAYDHKPHCEPDVMLEHGNPEPCPGSGVALSTAGHPLFQMFCMLAHARTLAPGLRVVATLGSLYTSLRQQPLSMSYSTTSIDDRCSLRLRP